MWFLGSKTFQSDWGLMDEGVKECNANRLDPLNFGTSRIPLSHSLQSIAAETQSFAVRQSGLTLHMSTRSIKREKKISDNLGLLEPTKDFFVLNS